MPFGDGTGSRGTGRMSGRGMGYCGTYNPVYLNQVSGFVPGSGTGRGQMTGSGRGIGRGRGSGRGQGSGRYFSRRNPYRARFNDSRGAY
jgi:hypothetical protein